MLFDVGMSMQKSVKHSPTQHLLTVRICTLLALTLVALIGVTQPFSAARNDRHIRGRRACHGDRKGGQLTVNAA